MRQPKRKVPCEFISLELNSRIDDLEMISCSEILEKASTEGNGVADETKENEKCLIKDSRTFLYTPVCHIKTDENF